MISKHLSKPRGLWRTGLIAGALVVVSGCSSATPDSALSQKDAAELRNLISHVRTAARAHNPDQANSAISALERKVKRLAREGNLATADMTAMLIGARQAKARVGIEVHAETDSSGPAPVPDAQPAPAPPPSPAPSGEPGKGDGKSKGHGKSEEHGKSGKGEGD